MFANYFLGINISYTRTIIFWLLSLSLSYSQTYLIKNYTMEDGLPSSKVHSIVQDKTGRMWFATRNGIAEYDGYDWTIFNVTNGLVSNEYIQLKADSSGKIWALTSTPVLSISYYDGKWNSFDMPAQDNLHPLMPICFDVFLENGEPVIGVVTIYSGVLIYENGKWTKINESNGLLSDQCFSIKQHDNKFYVCTMKGISVIQHLKVDNSINEKANPGAKAVYNVSFNKNSSGMDLLWLLGEDYLGYYENEKLIILNRDFNLHNFSYGVYPLLASFHGKIFFGDQYTLYVYDLSANKLSHLDTENGLYAFGPNSLLLDRENNVWVTGYRGVSKIESFRFATYTNIQGLFADEVSAIAQRNTGEIIFGHFDGLTTYDGKNFTKYRISGPSKEKSMQNRVLDLYKDKKGDIWIAAQSKGFGRLEKDNSIKWYKINDPGIIIDAVSIAGDSKGNIYGITTGKLYILRNGQFELENFHFYDPSASLRKLFILKDDRILITTMNKGVEVITSGNVAKYFRSSTNARANSVYSVYDDPALGLLVGTLDGLFYVHSDTLKKFKDGFAIDRPVYFINRDKENNIWFGTDNGVDKWNGNKLIHYGTSQGLSGLETNRDAFLNDKDGKVWIGTARGVSEYFEEFDCQNTDGMNIVKSILSDNKQLLPLKKAFEFDYGNNSITFDIRCISFVDEARNSYMAMLEGYDNNWTSESKGNDTRIRYTNLPPGTYKLKVKAKNSLGYWSSVYTSPDLVILKPFYMAWWFFALVFVALAGLSIGIYIYFVKLKYSKKLEEEVYNRTEQLNASERRYRQMFEENQAVILLVDAVTGRIMDANPSAISFYRYMPDIIKEMQLSDLDCGSGSIHISPEILTNKKSHITKHKLATGEERDVEIYLSELTFNEKSILYVMIHDISEKKRQETDLRKLSVVAAQSPVGIFITNKEGEIEYINKSMELLTGYTRDELTGKGISTLLSEIAGDSLIKELWNKVTAGFVWRGELPKRRKDGALYWARVSLAPIKDNNDEITHYLSMQEDITFEKYAREEIKNNEQLMNSVLNYVPIALFAIDKNGYFTVARGNGWKVMNIDPYKLVGGFYKEIGEVMPKLVNDIERAIKGEAFKNLQFFDDQIFEVHYNPVLDENDENTGTIGLLINITERYNHEQSLRESEEKNRALINAMPDMMFELDNEGNFLSFHKPDDFIFAGNPEYMVGKNISEVLPGEAAKTALENIKKALLQNKMQLQEYNTADSEEKKSYEARIVVAGINTVLAIVRDVTERREAIAELLKAKEDAERSDKLKSDFLAQISHEIRTPVNTILNFTSLLEIDVKDKVSNDLLESFRIINDGGMRLIRTIDMLLNMSQIQSDNYAPNFTEIDLDSDVLKNIAAEFSKLASDRNVDLIYSINTDSSRIFGDGYTLSQLFINLVDNAIKYTPRGKVEINLYSSDDVTCVDIKDTGIGIAKNYIPFLFQPFSQEETGYTRKFEGTGLGLALVQKYAEINKAEIKVNSVKGFGTTFTVLFNNRKS